MMATLKSIIQQLNELRDPVSISELEVRIKNWFKRNMNPVESDDIDLMILDGATKLSLKIHERIAPDFLMKTSVGGYLLLDERKFTKEILKGSGWYVATSLKSRFSEFHSLTLERDKGEQIKKPRYLYHFTYPEAIDRILKKGLIPDYSSGLYRSLEPRVYFFLEYDYEDARMLGYEYNVVLRLDTNKFSKFNIYDDERIRGAYSSAVWTPSHIPAYALEVVAEGETDDLPIHL